jgi:hypothetical protein
MPSIIDTFILSPSASPHSLLPHDAMNYSPQHTQPGGFTLPLRFHYIDSSLISFRFSLAHYDWPPTLFHLQQRLRLARFHRRR